LETDLTRIHKLSQERDDENWLFRSFLESHDIDNLDATVNRLFRQVSDAIDCTACGHCCQKIRPVLREKDIARVSRQLNISAKQVIARYVDKDEDGEQIFNRLPCPFLLEKMQRIRFTPIRLPVLSASSQRELYFQADRRGQQLFNLSHCLQCV
jgi:hypothetical protein